MSGAYGIWTSPQRASSNRKVIHETQQLSMGVDGSSALSVSVKASHATGLHFKSGAISQKRTKVRARQVGSRPLLQTLTQRGIDTTSRVSLDLDPRNIDGNPVVARAFTQSLNTRPYTKDQRTQQLRAMLVRKNPNTLHQPESFHVHSFFESAAPGFRIGAASSKQLAPPHSRKQHSVVELNHDVLAATTPNRPATLSQIYEEYTETKKKQKSLGANWPIGPQVEDARLWTAYDFRNIRKKAVPLAPLDPALPAVDEMPPVPQDSFFLLSNTNKLLPTAGFETLDGGGSVLPKRRKRNGRNHNSSSMSTTMPLLDVTLTAPLMRTRKLFGKTQISSEMNDPHSMLHAPSTPYHDSTGLMEFGDDQLLETSKKRPSTAPLMGGAHDGARLPGQMRMTVVVRQDKSRKKNRSRPQSENKEKEGDQTETKNKPPSNKEQSTGENAPPLNAPLNTHPLNHLTFWTTIPVCIIATKDCQTDREFLENKILPALNRSLTTRYVRLVAVDVHRSRNPSNSESKNGSKNESNNESNNDGANVGENLVDMLQLIELCGNYCIVLNGDRYGKSLCSDSMDAEIRHTLRSRGYDHVFDEKISSFDVQVRHVLKLSKAQVELTANQVQSGPQKLDKDGALCFLKPRIHQKNQPHQKHHNHDRQNSLDSFCHTMEKNSNILEYTSTLSLGEQVTALFKKRLQKQFPTKIKLSWFEKARLCNALFRKHHMEHGDGVPGLLEGVAESVKLNTGMSPVIVLGSQGIGKSHSMAVLADFIENAGEEWVLISHFVGASTASTKLCPALARMIAELMTIDQVTTNGLSLQDISTLLTCQNYPALCSLFRVMFNRAASFLGAQGKTLVILIDGIDQLEADRLEWLPTIVPQNAQFVLSSFKASSAMKMLWNRYGQLQTFDLDANPMPLMQLVGALKQAMVQRGTFDANGLPDDKLLINVIQKHKKANLQYVRAVAWRLHRGMTRGQSVLNSDLPKTTQRLLKEEVHQADVDMREWFVRHARHHGESIDSKRLAEWATASSTLFASILSAIWVSRTKLSFYELTHLVRHSLNTLWTMKDTIHSQHILRPNPTLIAATLVNSLGPHLGAGLESGHLRRLGFATTAMQDCIGNMFLKTPILRARAQGMMAAVCLDVGDPSATGTWFYPAGVEAKQVEEVGKVGEVGEVGKHDETGNVDGPKRKQWKHAIMHAVEYQLAGHEVLGLRATLCNPWYLMARCRIATLTPTGLTSILTDFQRALECLADPLYISLHCSIYDVDSETFESGLHHMTDALTELYQFMLHRQKELSRRPELCLQLALTEWMTVLPSKIVASEDLPHQDALFYWQNKPQRAPRLTAHVGYCVPITSCAVSYPSNDFAYPGGLAALGFQDGRISVISSLSGGTLFSIENEDTLGVQYRPGTHLPSGTPAASAQNTPSFAIDAVAFSSDNQVVVGKQGKDILLWVLPSGETFFRLPTSSSTAFSMCANRSLSSDMLLVGNASGYVSLWHITTPLDTMQGITLVSENYHGSNAPVTATACSSNSTFVISGTQSGALVIWRIEQGGLTKNATIDNGYRTPITSLCFRSDGQRIAACSKGDPTVKVWDMHGSMSREMCVDGIGVRAVAWSEDMRAIVTVPVHGTELIAWDAESSAKITILTGHHRPVSCVDFVWVPTGPNSVMCSLITGSEDCLARFWNFSGMVPGAPGRNRFAVSDNHSIENCVAAHASKQEYTHQEKEQTLASLGDLHGTNTRRLRTALSGHNGGKVLCCTSIICTGNKKVAATGGMDGAVCLWSIPKGRHIATVVGNRTPIHCVGMSDDGTLLASWEASGHLCVWEIKYNTTTLATKGQQDSNALQLPTISNVALVWSLELKNNDNAVVKTLLFDTDHHHLISCGSKGRLCRFVALTGEIVGSNRADISTFDPAHTSTGSASASASASLSVHHSVLGCTCNVDDGYLDVVDTAGVARSYDMESLGSTGPGQCLLSDAASNEPFNTLVGHWMDADDEQAHAVSIFNGNRAGDVRQVQVTPGGGLLTLNVLDVSARCVSFAVSTPPRWLALGWDDGLVHVCRIVGRGSLSLVGTLVTPASTTTLSLMEEEEEENTEKKDQEEPEQESSELCLTCGDASGNVCMFTTSVSKHATTTDVETAVLREKNTRATWAAMAVPECIVVFKDDGVDRSNITRNAHGSEEPHSDDPELWNIDGTEVDYWAKYKSGSQLWYLQSRAKESVAKTPPKPIPGTPMNQKAMDAGRLFAQE
jgi:WD40 repeat protein